MKTISYCITVCNEITEITELINFLQPRINDADEIVVQYDSSNVSDDVMEYLNVIKSLHGYTVIGFPLNGDFATFKNNIKQYCKNEYIFYIDADEKPHPVLVEHLSTVLESNPVDVIWVPRINTVDGLTKSHVVKWKWAISKIESEIGECKMDMNSGEYKLLKELEYIIEEYNNEDGIVVKYYKPIINLPDYQLRIARKTDDIHWVNKVHETLNGYDTFSNFPTMEEWSLYHPKSIEKQEKQNEFYSKITN